jgi:arylsulfatase
LRSSYWCLPPPRGPGRWELYNVRDDPGEVRDLARELPGKLAEMIEHYETYFHESGMFDAYALYQQRVKEGAEKLKW